MKLARARASKRLTRPNLFSRAFPVCIVVGIILVACQGSQTINSGKKSGATTTTSGSANTSAGNNSTGGSGFSLSSVVPLNGSLAGGTVLTIVGSGISTTISNVSVFFTPSTGGGSYPCTINTLSSTYLYCTTTSVPATGFYSVNVTSIAKTLTYGNNFLFTANSGVSTTGSATTGFATTGSATTGFTTSGSATTGSGNNTTSATTGSGNNTTSATTGSGNNTTSATTGSGNNTTSATTGSGNNTTSATTSGSGYSTTSATTTGGRTGTGLMHLASGPNYSGSVSNTFDLSATEISLGFCPTRGGCNPTQVSNYQPLCAGPECHADAEETLVACNDTGAGYCTFKISVGGLAKRAQFVAGANQIDASCTQESENAPLYCSTRGLANGVSASGESFCNEHFSLILYSDANPGSVSSSITIPNFLNYNCPR